MAPSTVLIGERLRPWRQAGLYLLFPADAVLETAARPDPQPNDQPAATDPQAPVATNRQTVSDTPAPVQQPSQPQAPTGTSPQPSPTVSSAQPTDQAFWPAPWDMYIAKARKPASFAITYFSLGQDLGGTPSDERRALFGSIISQVPLLAGNVSFWPMAAYDQDNTGQPFSPSAELFWRGLEQIKASVVLCFGSRALTCLHPQADAQINLATPKIATGPEHGVYAVSGIKILALPEPQEILRSGPEGPDAVASALRTLLGS